METGKEERMTLDFHKQAFLDCMEESDVFVVFGAGIGMEKLFTRVIQAHIRPVKSCSTSHHVRSRSTRKDIAMTIESPKNPGKRKRQEIGVNRHQDVDTIEQKEAALPPNQRIQEPIDYPEASNGDEKNFTWSYSKGRSPMLNPRRQLYFVLNANSKYDSVVDFLKKEGLCDEDLPQLITNEVLSSQRKRMYASVGQPVIGGSGVFFITARILVVDLLNGTINLSPSQAPPKSSEAAVQGMLAGLFIYNAHTVRGSSTEAFIIQIIRSSTQSGAKGGSSNPRRFIKCFSDQPERILRSSDTEYSMNKLSKVLSILTVDKLQLWPRFQKQVKETLARQTPVVKEVNLSLPKRIKRIQQNLLSLLEVYLNEITKHCKSEAVLSLLGNTKTSPVGSTVSSTSSYEKDLLTLSERSLRRMIEKEKGSEWKKLSYKVKNLITDFGVLKQLAQRLTRFDPVTFFLYLTQVKNENLNTFNVPKSMWLMTDQGDDILQTSKERVYLVVKSPICEKMTQDGRVTEAREEELVSVYSSDRKQQHMLKLVHEGNKKFQMVRHLSRAISTSSKDRRLLIVVKDDDTKVQLADYLSGQDTSLGKRQTKSFANFLKAVYHKYQALVLKELKRHFQQKSPGNRTLSTHAENEVVHLPASREEEPVDEVDFINALLELYKKRDKILKMLERSTEACSLDVTLLLSHAGQKQLAMMFHSIEARKHLTNALRTAEGHFRMLTAESRLLLLYFFTKVQPFEMHEVPSDEQSASEADGVEQRHLTRADATPFEADPSDPVWKISTMNEFCSGTILEHIRPAQVVLFSPDLECIRRIEVYQNELALGQVKEATGVEPTSVSLVEKVEVYMFFYKESIEEKLFLTEVKNEEKAFRDLIAEKSRVVLIGGTTERGEEDDLERILNGVGCGGRVLVDVREFRSQLPMSLFNRGLKVVPVQIEVGDYILSDEVCVERKALSDLLQSLSSGRLFKQLNNMKKAYGNFCLLLEFKGFAEWVGLLHYRDDSRQLRRNMTAKEAEQLDIRYKLALLSLYFPRLRVLWSYTDDFAAQLFTRLKRPFGEPALVTNAEVSVRNSSSVELLKRLPGVTRQNCEKLLKHTRSIKELCTLSQKELATLMGHVNAKKLHSFLNYSVFDGVSVPSDKK